MMQAAIDAMHASTVDVRDDGKAPPLVGAVLVWPDGHSESASRNELRIGDHAEFTLLDKKNDSKRLDGCTLYSTLEPCAPGSRKESKICCAERIVAARITSVYVGIEDPDPTVDRKGIEYLRTRGVQVHMFDQDFQEIIRQANAAFLGQALERAAVADDAMRAVLSSLEEPLKGTDLEALSTKALQLYAHAAGVPEPVESPAFRDRMIRQGVFDRRRSKVVPTGFGLLLFGKSPRESLPQSGLLATIHYPDDTLEPRDFDGPLIMIPEQFEAWLRDKLPNTIDRNQMQRRQAGNPPMEMIREAVVNALVHRDYDIAGAKCQVIINVDTITVRSPGSPVPPISLAQLQEFDAPMLSRNPRIHFVFSKMNLAEERGLGLRSLKDRATERGLPLPRYKWNPPYLDLVLYRSPESIERILSPDKVSSLSKAERAGWRWLSTKDSVTAAEYAHAMGVPARTALNHLKALTSSLLVSKEGSGRATRYKVIRNA